MNYLFAQALAAICERSVVAPGRALRCMAVVNPVAGGFHIKPKWEAHLKTLNLYQQKAQKNPQRQMHKNMIINLTEGKGSAVEITKQLLERAEKEKDPFYLIISAGGDGTHGEVMHSIYNAPAHIRSNMAILRLPMGTGNDGADSPTLEGAFELLLNPVHVEFVPAVQMIPSNNGSAISKGPFFAFNILSVGLDAYVTHMTNTKKGKKPSDSYKFWLDVAALFYDRKFKVDYMDVRALDNNNQEILLIKEKLLMLAMGASGHRTYGSQQNILPDDRNVCAIKQMPLFRKLAMKNKVTKGKHVDSPEVFILNAHRLEFSGKHPILAQMDGETILLQPEDFPAVMEITAPVIPLLKAGN